MPIEWLKARFAAFKTEALGELADELEDEAGEDLIEALAAATAYVAFADGVPSPEEREELLAVFEDEDRLTEIDLDDLFDAFDDYAERFAEDPKAAEDEVLAAVAVLDDSPELGRMIIRAAIAVASKDGSLTAAEEKAVRQLCDVLGLEVGELKQPARRGQGEDAGEEEDEEDI